MESGVVIKQVHMSEHAVDVASRVIVRELPFLKLLDDFVRKAQLGLASVAEAVQVFTGRDFKFCVGLAMKAAFSTDSLIGLT